LWRSADSVNVLFEPTVAAAATSVPARNTLGVGCTRVLAVPITLVVVIAPVPLICAASTGAIALTNLATATTNAMDFVVVSVRTRIGSSSLAYLPLLGACHALRVVTRHEAKPIVALVVVVTPVPLVCPTSSVALTHLAAPTTDAVDLEVAGVLTGMMLPVCTNLSHGELICTVSVVATTMAISATLVVIIAPEPLVCPTSTLVVALTYLTTPTSDAIDLVVVSIAARPVLVAGARLSHFSIIAWSGLLCACSDWALAGSTAGSSSRNLIRPTLALCTAATPVAPGANAVSSANSVPAARVSAVRV